MKTTIALTLVLAILTGCAQKEAAATPAAPKNAGAAPAPAANGTLQGKVLETFNSGGYTYLHISTSSGPQWAAVLETKIAKGQQVAVAREMTMEKFHSRTLNRTFDSIVFGSIAGHAGSAPVRTVAPAAQPGAPAAIADVKVERAPGGRTIAEVWSQKASLHGQEVVVRGKVVKYNGGILGKNWLHIRDGSGSQADGTNDLTITTMETAAVGDVLTVRGKLAVDKDFGSGYRYAAIVEEATIGR